MSHPSKVKGHSYERELVSKLNDEGLRAERAWGSNGEAMGEAPDVDVRFWDRGGRKWTVQAKRRKALPSYLKPSEDVDMVVMRQDRGQDLCVIPLPRLLELIDAARKDQR